MKPQSLAGLILCILVALPVTAVWAKDDESSNVATSAKRAADIAQQRNPGKVLSVKRDDGHFKVKILNQGKINYVLVKAK